MKKILLLLTIFAFISCKNEPKNMTYESDVADTEKTEIVSADDDNDNMLAYNPAKTDLKWTAYKTPEKVAVHGSFDSIVVRNTKESAISEEVLEGATFHISTSSMTTGDVSRDSKIMGLFFNNLEGKNILGSFGKFQDGVVPINITMNRVEITRNFQYTFENKKIIITGTIDVIEDFKANKGFDLLSEACAALHLDKSWTDVSIEIISDLEKPKA